MYEMETRIRFSETDETGKLSMSGLLRLFQDCGYFHAVARGQGHTVDDGRTHTWYLLNWRIETLRMPCCAEPVRVATWIYAEGGSVAKKQVMLYDAAGEVLARGDTLWAYIDIATGTPALPPKGVWKPEDYGARIPLVWPLRRVKPIAPGAEGVITLPLDRVDGRMLDINRHANNVLFTEYALSLAAMQTPVRHLASEFLRQAKAGETLCPCLLRDGGGVTVSVMSRTGDVFALFRFES